MTRSQITKKWGHYSRIGLHAGLAVFFSTAVVQFLFYAMSAPVFSWFDGGRNQGIAIGLTIMFTILIGIPLFGLIFSKIYPNNHSVETDVTSQQDNEAESDRQVVLTPTHTSGHTD